MDNKKINRILASYTDAVSGYREVIIIIFAFALVLAEGGFFLNNRTWELQTISNTERIK